MATHLAPVGSERVDAWPAAESASWPAEVESPRGPEISAEMGAEMGALATALLRAGASADEAQALCHALQTLGAAEALRRLAQAPEAIHEEPDASGTSLDDLIDPDLLLARVEASGWRQLVVAVLARLRTRQPRLELDLDWLLDELTDRPRIRGWLLGSGVALAHLEVPALDEVVMAVATTHRPLRTCGPDGIPIRIAFFLFEPSVQPENHLKILSRIAGVCAYASNLGLLLAAVSPEALLDALSVLDDDMSGVRRSS